MQIYSSGQIWKTPPFQDYGLMATVKDSVSFLVTETVHLGIMPLVHFSAFGEMVLGLHI